MDISINFKGGGSFVKLRPVFSLNGENVFVSSRNCILEYNVKTGKLIHEYKGMKNNIIGFSYDLIDDIECLTACSENGQVIVWKTIFKVKIYETEIKKQNIKNFHLISYNLEDGLEALISFANTKRTTFTICNIKHNTLQKPLLKLRSDKEHKVGFSQKYFSVVQENIIYFVDFQRTRYNRYSMAKNNRTFMCVTCHPNEDVVLAGDNTGRVIVWEGIFSKIVQSVFHWHTLSVNAVAFSSSGTNFYSGANECVLVKWQFDKPDFKQFLPRLAAGICHITVSNNNAYLALATLDNAIRIIDSQLNQVSLIQHLVLGKQFESGITYDPITKALILNGNTGCLQFFSAGDMSLLYNIDVVGQNKITDERDCKMENTEVRKVALSKNGRWLSTVENRRSADVCSEHRLKFWHFESKKQMYELNTSIEFPHEEEINSIAFQPLTRDNDLKCVTIGNDKKFKIWQLTVVTAVNKTGLAWKCWSIGFYRQLPCKSLSFSVDGSLFATAFESILTAWTPDSCELKCSLVHPKYKESIQQVQFAQGNQCHMLVAAGKNYVSVWNLLTLCMLWVVTLDKIDLLLADSLSTNMLVICANKLYIFEPSSPTVLYSDDNLIKESNTIVAAAFIPGKYSNDSRLKWYERSNLYYITSENELYCISKSEEALEYEQVIEDLSEDMSVFSKIKASTTTKSVQEALYRKHLYERDVGHKTLREYLDASLLTLPPVRLQAASILKSFILQKDTIS